MRFFLNSSASMNPTPSIPEHAPFDPEALERLRALARETDPDLYADILNTFKADLAKYLDSLQQAILGQDVKTLENTAHAMKGASMNTGALTLAGLSAQMEDAAESGGLTPIPGLLVAIEREIKRVQVDIDLELSAAA